MKTYVETLHTRPKGPEGAWKDQHMLALSRPSGFEIPIVNMIRAWLSYADQHKKEYESGIGEDGVLGEDWSQIGLSLLGLLNGNCGGLDCGTLDGVIRSAMKSEGFDPDTM